MQTWLLRSLGRITNYTNWRTTLKFDEHGLVPAIIQDAATNKVLTLAYMNEESLSRTLETRETWFWSRSRNELWHKGATSGNTQSVVGVTVDCDEDAVLVRVYPHGPACHLGELSCFHEPVLIDSDQISRPPDDFDSQIENLFRVIQSRKHQRPKGSYTSYLFEEGIDKILKKLGEEASETIIAAKNENQQQLVGEVSDLIYHLLVLLSAKNVKLDDVRLELARRANSE
jgi:phosphoribosyl-AMP cyclohydrolase / phosphoribosyl-ATP pyrophosphohydrolase